MNAYWIGVIILAVIYFAVVFPNIPEIFAKLDSDYDGTWLGLEESVVLAGFLGILVGFISFMSYWIFLVLPIFGIYMLFRPIRKWFRKLIN